MLPSTFPFLYGITDTHIMPGDLLEAKCESALQAGLKILQYRNKSFDKEGEKAGRLREASRLKLLCQRYDATFIVNDDVELALAVGADGVHLGLQDTSIKQARHQLGEHAVIGATCHGSIELAIKAISDGASYVAFGRFFPSRTKEDALKTELSVLKQAKQNLHVPIVAIGGIDPKNADSVWNAGADCVAVCHALFADSDPAHRVNQFKKLFEKTHE